jgi:hypothetical protein
LRERWRRSRLADLYCEQSTRKYFVNIYNLEHYKRNKTPIRYFKCLEDLSKWSKENHRIYPLGLAKGTVMKFLLRPILKRDPRQVERKVWPSCNLIC